MLATRFDYEEIAPAMTISGALSGFSSFNKRDKNKIENERKSPKND